MSENVSPQPEARDPKFDLAYDPEQLRRFEPDHPDAPVIGFIYDENDESNEEVKLIVMEHNVVSHPATMLIYGEERIFYPDVPLKLIYTPNEWVAYYWAVKQGQFDLRPDTTLPMIRDSKAPNQHFFLFTIDGYGTFIDAVKSGKYDLARDQHDKVVAGLIAKNPSSRDQAYISSNTMAI